MKQWIMENTRHAAAQMTAAAAKDSNCIDCHKGIAHHKPDMSSGFRDRYKQATAGRKTVNCDDAVFVKRKTLTATAGAPAGKALLFPATQVKVLQRGKQRPVGSDRLA